MHGPRWLLGRTRHVASALAEAPRRRRGRRVLASRGDESALAILAAVDAHRPSGLGELEAAWARRIEELRGELLGDRRELPVHGTEYSGDSGDSRVESHTVAETCRTGSKPPQWCRLLMRLVAAWAPASALELGTCCGISAAYQAAGLRLDGGGRLVSMDASASRLALAGEVLARLGLEDVELVRGRFADTLAPTLARLAPIEYAFIDGHHDEHATEQYFEQIAERCAPRALVVVDDIVWSDGMRAAWSRIATHPAVGLAVDLGDLGIVSLGGAPGQLVDLPLR